MYKRVNFEPMDKHLSESIRGKLEEAEALIMQLPAGRNRSIALTKVGRYNASCEPRNL